MADTIKCPHCAANLKFAAGAQKLQCPFCGGTFALDEVESKAVDEMMAESKPVEKPAGQTSEDSQEQAATQEQPAMEKRELDHLEAIENASEHSSDNVEFVCNSCGGKILSDSSTAASFCPFCGSPALIGQRLNGQFEPKFIIPFKYDREAAEKAFLKWCKGGKYTPVKFVSQENVAKLTGLYVPFWLFNVSGDVSVDGTGKTSRTSGDYTIITDYKFNIDGNVKWEKIPLDGETRINDELMEAIEPYNYKDLVPYDYKYLPGFFADRFDQSEEDLRKRAAQRAKDYLDKEIKQQTKKYDSHKIEHNQTRYHDIKAEYALLPVWFMQYKYLGKSYYFAMNGQTGEVAGKAPVSKVKQTMFYSVSLAITAVIARFIAGLIMGGFVG